MEQQEAGNAPSTPLAPATPEPLATHSSATVVLPPPTPPKPPEPASPAQAPLTSWRKNPWLKGILGAVLLLLILGGGLYLYTNKQGGGYTKQFTKVYSFVPEKISKSAAVRISLPKGVNEATAQTAITFDPKVEGSWKEDGEDGVLTYVPKEALTAGIYYAVSLDTDTVRMSGDFYVDEDPSIIAIFPKTEGESHEDSEITIMFNRPMVPLTTLAVQEEIPLPITITPPTEGRFKWVSTRTLQFIPETTLIPSSEYTVDIEGGLTSIDGLSVTAKSHTFKTRVLRLESSSEGVLGYRAPIVLNFNQPVDLEKTSRTIEVRKKDNEAVSTLVTYGEKTEIDYRTGKKTTSEDQSVLFVYQKRDSHGRERFWDFETTYTYTLDSATPLAGTLPLESGKRGAVQVPGILESVTAQSDRSDHVRPDMFDQKGKLSLRFYDDINKDASNISADGLRDITYGERCAQDEFGEEIWRDGECKKETDYKNLLLSFDENMGRNVAFDLRLEKIVTKDDIRITTDAITLPLKTYPTFAITRTAPSTGALDASVSGMRVCSNTPLKDPKEEGLKKYISANNYFVGGRWEESMLVTPEMKNSTWANLVCAIGEFETKIQYGLLPKEAYTLNVSFVDEFDQTAKQTLTFTTGAPQAEYTRFHNMQKVYNVTKPGRTKLTYAVENLEYVDVHVCKMSPEAFISRLTSMPDVSAPPDSLGCANVVTERIELPKRYWVNNYFTVDLFKYSADVRGHYVVTFSNPLYRRFNNRTEQQEALYDRTYVSVTNLAVGKKEVVSAELPTTDVRRDANWQIYDVPISASRHKVIRDRLGRDKNLYWIIDSTTLSPVSGARVVQYRQNHATRYGDSAGSAWASAEATTDGQGVARTDIEQNVSGAIVYANGESAIVSDWGDSLQYAGETRDASRTYIYTDRPIYRPGHTIYIRGIDRVGFDGSYEVSEGTPLTLEIFDARDKKIYDTKLTLSQYGTFDASFVLPADAPLGTYRISAFNNTAYVDVEEYVGAAFKLEATSDKEEYINTDTFKIDIQADYYFGVPLTTGTVSYSVTSQDYHFDKYSDERFSFGKGWYYCYECGFGDKYLYRGEATLDERGQAAIEKTFNFAELFKDASEEDSKLVTVTVTVKDSNGRSVSTQKTFIVHKSDFYIGVATDKYYTQKNSPILLSVKTVDTSGSPVAIGDIKRSVYKVRWETTKRQEVDGGFYYRSKKQLDRVSEEDISTNKSGDWSGNLSFAEEGEYEVHVIKQDKRGVSVKSIAHLYIYGDKAVTIPQNNNYELELEVDGKKLEVGKMGSVLIKSPYPRAKVLITAERGTIYDYWIVEVNGGLYLHEFPIKAEYAPNVYISALLLAPVPEVKSGSVRLDIVGKEHSLDISMVPTKKEYLPGEDVSVDIYAKDGSGKPVSAEVSVAVADLSVLALKGNPKKNPEIFFYDGFPLSVSTESNIKNILYEVDIPLGSKGGGGASPDDLAKKKRGLFKDTAFWTATAVTDASGHARVTFTLPDNLTTWQIESLGVTKDTKLGVGYDEFTTKKDLMAVPLRPRFIIPGDEFSLGAKVFNQTDETVSVSVSLESDTLEFPSEQADTITINAKDSKTVYFDTVAPSKVRAGSHTFTFTASGDNLLDVVEQTIPITKPTTYETVATANMTLENEATEYIYVPGEVVSGEGGLTINANATMAVFMMDSLTYMASYPYGCSEQLASSLSTIAVLTKALTVPNVEGNFDSITFDGTTYTVLDVVNSGLSKIYETQNAEGGFSYYKGLEPNLYLTMHVADALTQLSLAGYDVRNDVIERAYVYIEKETLAAYTKAPNFVNETVILAEYILRTVKPLNETKLTRIVSGLVTDDAFNNETLDNETLAYLSILTSKGYSGEVSKRVYNALISRIDIDGRGAHLENRTDKGAYYQTPIKDTALLLRAIVAHEDDNPALPNVLRWLLSSRDKNGVWGSTHNTFSVVAAFVQYLTWRHETESQFTLRGFIDGVEKFVHEFSPKNIFTTFTHFIAIDDIEREKLLPITMKRDDTFGKQSPLYYDMALKYYLPVESVPSRDEGITITRGLYALTDSEENDALKSAKVGDVLKGKLTLSIPSSYQDLAIEDVIPAGFEIVNLELETEDQSIAESVGEEKPPALAVAPVREKTSFAGGIISWFSSLGGDTQVAQIFKRPVSNGGTKESKARKLYPTYIENHDDRVYLYVETLAPGVYEFEYFLRALVPGKFKHMPARAEEMYFPEIFGQTDGDIFTVKEAE